MAQLKLRTGDVMIPAHLTSTALRTSPHTGAALNLLSVIIESRNPADNAILDKLATDKPLFDAEFEGAPEDCKWQLGDTSYNFREGSPVRTYQWELAQRELLRIDELWLQDIRLEPYRYVERFEENRLGIHACVKLDQNQRRALTALPASFPVVRKGITDVPREMRLGRSVWSSTEPEAETKAELYLLDHDPTARLDFLQPLIGNLENFSTFSIVAMNQLLNVLSDRGILDQATVAGIRDAANTAASDAVFSRTYGVVDLDRWLENTAEDKKYSD